MNYEFQPTCQIPPEKLNELYKSAFGFKHKGFFVEFGAHDGWHWSCTWGLAQLGWRGVYAEPDIVLYNECKKTIRSRPRVSVWRCCIGRENGTITLGQGEYGATKDSNSAAFQVQQFTLDTFLKARKVPFGFDLLVIDVEGMEADVFAGFTCKNWMPKMIIVERPPENNFESLGYEKVYSDWINTVYTLKK